MDRNRAAWNKQQHHLQDALLHPKEHPEYLGLFLSQHAQVHTTKMSNSKEWSFVDEVLLGLDDIALRSIPTGSEHSVIWILWHMARCEDLTMNILVAGADQVIEEQDWIKKLHSPFLHTGNAINLQEIIHFSQAIELDSLAAYRVAVGESTRRVVNQLKPDHLGQKVDPKLIMRVRQMEAVLPSADGIVNYWSKRTIAGLLLMPPTRHCFTHLNEALRIKQALHFK